MIFFCLAPVHENTIASYSLQALFLPFKPLLQNALIPLKIFIRMLS